VLLDHGDAELVVKINGVGSGKETGEQPLNSMGRSVDTDLRVFKTKIKQTWTYNQTAKNRFSLRITLENRMVGLDRSR